MNSKDLSIAIISCDAYKDIAENYITLLQRHWVPCEYDIYIATETLEFDKPIISVKSGINATWTQKALDILNATKTDYILLSVDDLFISKQVDVVAISQIVDFIKESNIDYYRIPVFKANNGSIKNYPGNDYAELIPSNKRYNVSIGTAIWSRKELMTILGDGTMSAWDLEEYFLKQAEKAKPGYLDNYVSDRRCLLGTVHMIKNGKWIPSSVKKIESLNLNIDYTERGYIGIMDNIKQSSRIYCWLSKNMPTGMRNCVKKILRKFGFKFASNS